MKNKLWLFQIPFVLVFTFFYWVTEQGLQGELNNHFLDQKVYPALQRVSTLFSDAKFRVRGPTAPKNKVVVVEVDSPAIEQFGRWPWHRNHIAHLIDNIFAAGAKVVGLDIVFSEQDPRVPADLKNFLETRGILAQQTDQFETDHALTSVVFKHADHLVMGIASEAMCHPNQAFRGYVNKVADFDPEVCPVPPVGPEVASNFPAGFDKFALPEAILPDGFSGWKTPIWTALTFLSNIEEYSSVATHSGYFNAFPDQDQVIRRAQVVMLYNGKIYPALPLEMARIGLDEKIVLELDPQERVRHLSFAKSGRDLPITAMGSIEINFRGGGQTFPYVSAAEMMNDQTEQLEDQANRKLAGISKKDVLKDAYVLVGVTALGTNDMRAFPMDSNVAGVEGHANILDNLLSADMLTPGYRSKGSVFILGLMVIGAMLFGFAVQRFEAIPALLLFVAVFSGAGYADYKAFVHGISLNSSFFYLEYFCIFLFTLAVKYVLEERNKKFVRSAFAKYVAPAVVDSILKDPAKLTVGGEKRDLTIMFSDIRSFTTFSERLDAKVLAQFLNDYLGIMTKIVFANNGTLDKYIGDAIMAFWGAPLDQPKHALNSCKAAVAMMQALAQNKKRWFEQFNVDVNVGVGINSGPVNVGNMGSTDNFAYTVIGDHVNLSSRLEGLTKAYTVTILTTRFTFDEIEKAGDKLPDHRVLDHVKVKGKKKAVELIQVLDRPYSDEGLALFQEGRKLYTEQQWDTATEKFMQANVLLAVSAEVPDGPCAMYLERCRDFKAAPPEKDWDGSWEMHSK
ncbi:adenylate/guanylate cyclase domain-containing protein [Bdellovibrionota bacterium FG-1]